MKKKATNKLENEVINVGTKAIKKLLGGNSTKSSKKSSSDSIGSTLAKGLINKMFK